MTDERNGKPSASGYERLYLCPGSFAAERGLPNMSSDEASEGTRIHAIIEVITRSEIYGKELPQGFDEAELDKAWSLYNQAIRMRDEWLDGAELTETLIEERLWFSPGFSGKADLIFISGNRALILDFKTGWGDHEANATNMQLRALAAIISRRPDIEEVTAAIVQLGRKEAAVVYDKAALGIASAEVSETLMDAHEDNAKRIPGEKQCRYCKARLNCPEATGKLQQMAEVGIEQCSPQSWALVTPAQKLMLAKNCKLVTALAADITKRIKEDLTSYPDSIPGLSLVEGNSIRGINDSLAAWEKLGGLFTVEEFTGAMTASVPKLEDAYYRKRKAADPKVNKMSAKAEFENILGDLIEAKQNQPSIGIL